MIAGTETEYVEIICSQLQVRSPSPAHQHSYTYILHWITICCTYWRFCTSRYRRCRRCSDCCSVRCCFDSTDSTKLTRSFLHVEQTHCTKFLKKSPKTYTVHMSKISKFSHLFVFYAPAEGVPLGIGNRRMGSKTTVTGLPGRARSLMISLVVWIQSTNVTDRWTDRHRATAKTALTHRVAR